MNKLRKRVLFDLVLTALLVFEMLMQLTGPFLHEVVGALFFVCITAHLILSRKWIASMARAIDEGRRLSGPRKRLVVVDVLLAADFIVLAISSVAISNILYDMGINLAGGAYALWAAIHIISSYGLCMLTAVHLGLHWTSIFKAFEVPYDPQRRAAINVGVGAVVALASVALGNSAMRAAFAKPEELGATDIDPDDAAPSGTLDYEPVVNDAMAQEQVSDTVSEPESLPLAEEQPVAESQNSSPEPEYVEQRQEAPSYENESFEEETVEQAMEYCPICHNHCPLTSPRCRRPYDAGYIS